MNLKYKIVVVTGAGGGIGKALSEVFMREESTLVLIAKAKEDVNEMKKKYGQNHKYYVCDLSKREDLLGLINNLKKDLKHIDLLVNLAGIGIYKSIKDVNLQEWDTSIAANVSAPFILTRELLSLMQKKSDSLILNIGSGAGVIPMKNRSVYCATKFALRGLSLSLSEEFKGKSPSFCLITLGSTLTSFGIGNALTLEEKIEQNKKGSAYFTTEWVANKLIEIVKDNNRPAEVVLYPSDYGFGTWKKS